MRLRHGRTHRARGDEKHEPGQPEQRLRAGERTLALLEVVTERKERRHGGERHRGEQHVPRDAVGSTGVGDRGDCREDDRESSTKHWQLASLLTRTVLLCSRRPRRKDPMTSVTWLGHGSYRLDTSDGTRVYVDPWLSSPTTPEAEKDVERADVIALTHGHGDHVGDAVSIQQKTGATVL